MTDTRLRRPRLLFAAARAGLAQYRRDRDLAGLAAPGRGLLAALAAVEAACEAERRSAAPGYSAARHVRALTALMAESRAVTASRSASEPTDAAAPAVALPARRGRRPVALEFKSAA